MARRRRCNGGAIFNAARKALFNAACRRIRGALQVNSDLIRRLTPDFTRPCRTASSTRRTSKTPLRIGDVIRHEVLFNTELKRA